MPPEAEIELREKPAPGRSGPVVVLERVQANYTPAYCLHGYASCVLCDSLCYMGSETSQMIKSKGYSPICGQCANRLASEGALTEADRIGNTHDHLRRDGPH